MSDAKAWSSKSGLRFGGLNHSMLGLGVHRVQRISSKMRGLV